MVVLEDFTRMSLGQRISLEGYVEHCRRCGRPGLEEHFGGRETVVIHSQTSEILGDGMRVEPQDCCAVPSANTNANGRRNGGDIAFQNRAI
jgi:hypothetical protein